MTFLYDFKNDKKIPISSSPLKFPLSKFIAFEDGGGMLVGSNSYTVSNLHRFGLEYIWRNLQKEYKRNIGVGIKNGYGKFIYIFDKEMNLVFKRLMPSRLFSFYNGGVYLGKKEILLVGIENREKMIIDKIRIW
jgi:hypothetical protein